MIQSCTWSGWGARGYYFETCSRDYNGNLVCSIPQGASQGTSRPIHYVLVSPQRQKYGIKIYVKGYVATQPPGHCAEFLNATGLPSREWVEDKPVSGIPVEFNSSTIRHRHQGTENIHLEVWEQPGPDPTRKNHLDYGNIAFPISLL